MRKRIPHSSPCCRVAVIPSRGCHAPLASCNARLAENPHQPAGLHGLEGPRPNVGSGSSLRVVCKVTQTSPWFHSPAMDDTADTAQVIIRPPLALGLAVIAGLALDWLVPLPFLPADLPAGWLGAMVFVVALAL